MTTHATQVFKSASLTPTLRAVLEDKGTEQSFSGEYTDSEDAGTYLCRRCGLALFRSKTKFHSGCGWPSFDEEIKDAVKQIPDKDGRRTEILCARCDGHLGHVFVGENFTGKNTRHCVNSVSLDFVPNLTVTDTEEAIFAAGCFWGVEYYFKKLDGVLKTEVGYTGGSKSNPTYKDVCSGRTGQYEAIRVVYDPSKVNFEALTKYFFEIHDPTQDNGQGPDLGSQYLSVVFYYNDEQKTTAVKLIAALENKGYHVKTKVLPISIFWPAELYHQNYYTKNGETPYCHRYEKKF